MSYRGLLSITENPLLRLFIFGLLYPDVHLLGTVGYSGHYLRGSTYLTKTPGCYKTK